MLRKKCPDKRFERCQCASCGREACGCLYADKLELDCPIQNCGEYKRAADEVEPKRTEGGN